MSYRGRTGLEVTVFALSVFTLSSSPRAHSLSSFYITSTICVAYLPIISGKASITMAVSFYLQVVI